MAMLAEPRQKRRYHLTPKGKPLFEDNERFGTKMLEKMGWSKGKGLGKSEDGVQDFIRVKYKSDEKGLGFQVRDDQWTEHEKNFNGLLQNLNGDTAGESADECETITPTVGLGLVVKSKKKKLKDNISGQSLEERSKKSKARVHYQKFTKGKDMSQYSEKDLANIFGKKATPEETNIYSQFQAFNVGGSESDAKEDANKKETTSDETKEILPPIINTGVSVNDYFKAKMEALKQKQGLTSSNPFNSNIRLVNNVEVVIPSAKRKRSTDEEVQEDGEEKVLSKKSKLIDDEVSRENGEEEVPRKKKKSKKHVIENGENGIVDLVTESETKEVIEEKVHKEKKKRKKDAQPEDTPNDEIKEQEDNTTLESRSSKRNKKSKKSQEEVTINEEEHVENACVIEEDEIPKKKKKKNKKKTLDTENISEETSEIPLSTEQQPPLESRTENIENTPAPVEANNTSESVKPKKKKKNKNKNNDTEVSSQPTDMTPLTNKQKYSPDTYTISTFCAEKFRNIIPHEFQGSNLMDLIGYGLNANINLNIKKIPNDAERIMRLWSGTLDKYTHSSSQRKLYSTYVKKVKLARGTKSHIPDLRVKSIARKSMFQIKTCGL